MKRTHLWIVGLSSLLALSGSPVTAEDHAVTPQVAPAPTPNAAVIYWSAFGVMPSLSQEQRKAIREAAYSSEAIPDAVQTDLGYYSSSLRELHRALRVPACDWTLDRNAGPFLLLPHCQHARDLAAAGLLRSRLFFEKGDTDAAINDVVAVLHMARECGQDPIVIAMLVDVAIERNACEVLARNLSRLSPAQLDNVLQRMQSLPATPTTAAAFRDESQLYGDWVGRRIKEEFTGHEPGMGLRILTKILKEANLGDSLNGTTDQETQRRRELISSATLDDLRAMVQKMKADYEEIARIADLPYPDRAAPFAKFDEGLAKSRQLANRDDLPRVLSINFLPSYTLISRRIEESHVRRQLLELAIRAQRDGRDSIRGASIHAVEVKLEASGPGFQLTYQLPGAEKPEVLTVPKK